MKFKFKNKQCKISLDERQEYLLILDESGNKCIERYFRPRVMSIQKYCIQINAFKEILPDKTGVKRYKFEELIFIYSEVSSQSNKKQLNKIAGKPLGHIEPRLTLLGNRAGQNFTAGNNSRINTDREAQSPRSLNIEK